MGKEIINLETSPSIGIFYSLFEGLTCFFKNFTGFCKMLKPVFLISLSVSVIFLSLYLVHKEIKTGFSLIGVLFGLILFLYSFWQVLKGHVAISYFAKDVYENREIQKPKQYTSYVEEHAKSYIEYYLWNFLFTNAAILFPFIFTVFSIMLDDTGLYTKLILFFIGIILFVLFVPFFIGIVYLGHIFWAYRDKADPLDSLIESIKASYKNFLPLLGFSIVFHILLNPVFTILITIIDATTMFADKLNNIIFGTIITLEVFILVFLSAASGYLSSFVFTRCYFELVKKQN